LQVEDIKTEEVDDKATPEEKVEEKEAEAEPMPSEEPDIDLSCQESLEPLVDIRKEASAPKDVEIEDGGIVIERATASESKVEAAVVKKAQEIYSPKLPGGETVENLEQGEVKKDGTGKKKKKSREDASEKEDHEKPEKKKGKKKRRFSKELPKDDDDEQDDGVVEKKKKRKKKDSGDSEAHGEKRKKKTRKKKKEYDEDSDAAHSDFAEKIAKEMLKLKDEKVHLPVVGSGAVKGQYSVSAMFSGDVLGARVPQPSHSGASLLHDLASACEKASQPRAMSSAVMDNTPPTTPEGSPSGAGSSASNISPCNEEVQSTKSEHEANIEVARYMTGEGHLVGGDSPNPCDTSIVSNCSAGSSGNIPSSESGTELGMKRKIEEEGEEPVQKKKRRSRKGKTEKKHSSKHQGRLIFFSTCMSLADIVFL
jgi:hypothetical protein